VCHGAFRFRNATSGSVSSSVRVIGRTLPGASGWWKGRAARGLSRTNPASGPGRCLDPVGPAAAPGPGARWLTWNVAVSGPAASAKVPAAAGVSQLPWSWAEEQGPLDTPARPKRSAIPAGAYFFHWHRCFQPIREKDNSPAFQRRDSGPRWSQVRDGSKAVSAAIGTAVPDGTDSFRAAPAQGWNAGLFAFARLG
jgi:hypothetical protein